MNNLEDLDYDINYNINDSSSSLNNHSFASKFSEEEKFESCEPDNECPICLNPINDEDRVVLKCKHAFHYNCIMTIFKNDKSYYYKTKKNICPYCRGDGGYLPLRPGVIPLKNIHKEYIEYKSTGNIEKYLVKNVCCAILKSGKNAGSQCKKPLSKTSSKYCKRHEMVYKKINI